MKILLLAIRPLMRFRTYTLINVLGLALSLACVIIISRYVYSELQIIFIRIWNGYILRQKKQTEVRVISLFLPL